MKLLRDAGYELGNIDATVAAERPKLNSPYPSDEENAGRGHERDEEDISIKATTTEKLGFTGRQVRDLGLRYGLDTAHGIVNQKVLPFPSSDSTPIFP